MSRKIYDIFKKMRFGVEGEIPYYYPIDGRIIDEIDSLHTFCVGTKALICGDLEEIGHASPN